MTTTPSVGRKNMQPNQSPADASVRSSSPWGVISAIPLFIYGAVPLLVGGVGLLFVPALFAGVTIGGNTTSGKIFVWILFHLAVAAHGCAIIVAAVRFLKLRWRRGLYTMAVGVAVPGTVIAALYLCYFVVGVTD